MRQKACISRKASQLIANGLSDCYRVIAKAMNRAAV